MKKFIILISLILTTSSVFAESEYGPEFDLYQSGYTDDGWWTAPSGLTYRNIDEPIDYNICVDYKVNEWTLCKEILKSRGYRFHNTIDDIDVSETYEADFKLAYYSQS
tara:strand:+ start:64 stop:387 length:324 start_codon:yes stop_codon:yes gene_type:complete